MVLATYRLHYRDQRFRGGNYETESYLRSVYALL